MGTLRLSYVLVIAQVGKRGQGNNRGTAYPCTRPGIGKVSPISKSSRIPKSSGFAIFHDRSGRINGIGSSFLPYRWRSPVRGPSAYTRCPCPLILRSKDS